MNSNDIHFEYNTKGYMLYYKGKPIGGAGIDKFAKGSRANLKLFHDMASKDKKAILEGHGFIYYMDRIKEIDKEETE